MVNRLGPFGCDGGCDRPHHDRPLHRTDKTARRPVAGWFLTGVAALWRPGGCLFKHKNAHQMRQASLVAGLIDVEQSLSRHEVPA
jgi:hypothetical protein